MKEVKNPKKPLAYYYSITLIALLLFNIFVAPLLNRQHVEQTDYSTFMRMIAEKKIGKVDVSDTEIVFTDKDDNTIYVTGVMYDPTLTQRLYDSGAGHLFYFRPVHAEKAHGSDGRQRRHVLRHGKEQCQDLRPVHARHPL